MVRLYRHVHVSMVPYWHHTRLFPALIGHLAQWKWEQELAATVQSGLGPSNAVESDNKGYWHLHSWICKDSTLAWHLQSSTFLMNRGLNNRARLGPHFIFSHHSARSWSWRSFQLAAESQDPGAEGLPVAGVCIRVHGYHPNALVYFLPEAVHDHFRDEIHALWADHKSPGGAGAWRRSIAAPTASLGHIELPEC